MTQGIEATDKYLLQNIENGQQIFQWGNFTYFVRILDFTSNMNP